MLLFILQIYYITYLFIYWEYFSRKKCFKKRDIYFKNLLTCRQKYVIMYM